MRAALVVLLVLGAQTATAQAPARRYALIIGSAESNRPLGVPELGEYLQERVVNYSGGGQHPQHGKLSNPQLNRGDFVFVVPRRKEPGR